MKDFNEKCAEYLGWTKVIPNGKILERSVWFWSTVKDKSEIYLKFDRDWNWIMLIIEKIMKECFENDTNEAFKDYYCILDALPDLEKTKQAIYNYITNDEII